MKLKIKLLLSVLGLLAVVWAMASCKGKEKKQNETGAVAEEAQIDKKEFPWDFPLNFKLNAAEGQAVIAPGGYTDEVEAGKDLLEETFTYSNYTLESVGETHSTIDGKQVPNALIVPIPAGQTAAQGDILLLASMGRQFSRGIVIDDSSPEKPEVSYLDGSEYPADTETFDGRKLFGDDFIKLQDGTWSSGMPIAVYDGEIWLVGRIINATSDKVLAFGNSGEILSADIKNCRLLPLKPRLKTGDIVNAMWVNHFSDGFTVEKFDEALGRVWVKKGDNSMIVSTMQVAGVLK